MDYTKGSLGAMGRVDLTCGHDIFINFICYDRNLARHNRLSHVRSHFLCSQCLVVKRGVILSKLVAEVNGTSNKDELAFIKRLNPIAIENMDHIEVGQEIMVPPYWPSKRDPFFTVHIASVDSLKRAQELYQRLKSAGYPANIVLAPAFDGREIFRMTIGGFRDKKAAETYASTLPRNRIAKLSEIQALERKFNDDTGFE